MLYSAGFGQVKQVLKATFDAPRLKNHDGGKAGPFRTEAAVRHKRFADSQKGDRKSVHKSRLGSSRLLKHAYSLGIPVLLVLSLSDGERAASALDASLTGMSSLLARASVR